MFDQEIRVRDIGSFYIGGELASLSGLAEREVRYAANAPPLRVDPNGTYVHGQVYVHYVRLAHPISRLPVLFLNGGTSTGATWETTPDGRPGWQSMFLKSGYDTYVTDGCGKGRASMAPFPDIILTMPVFRPHEQTWRLLRIGPRYTIDPATREAFPGTQFPVSHFDDYAKQIVPRFTGQDATELTACRALIERIGPCIIVAQRSGGALATLLAAEMPSRVKAIVTVEMTAAPDLSTLNCNALATVPQLILWGDNWRATQPWQDIRKAIDDYSAAIRSKGCDIAIDDLPGRGLLGNSHQMMLDGNNDLIAKIVLGWLSRRIKL